MDVDVLTLEETFSLPLQAQNDAKKSRNKSFNAESVLARRIFDLAAATVLLVVLSPLMFLCAALVLISSGRPVFYRQQRLTVGGREFSMFKFRSMTHDAEHETGAIWASREDPRVTPVGRVLRKYHLDELPQLFNILAGDMSLIGPRPERPEFGAALAERYPSYRHRLRVPAGLTGLAQVEHGYCDSMETYRRKIALDRLYVRRRSMKLDCAIAFRTFLVVLNGG